MATFRQSLGNLVSVPLTMSLLWVKKLFYSKNLFFSGIHRFSPGVVLTTDKKSRIRLGEQVSIHSRSRISASNGGKLRIGNRTSFNVGCILTCRHSIRIGNNVVFGPNVMIYDHDHIMDREKGTRGTGYTYGEVVIGDNSWIGAGSIILKGAHIGNNCVIAAGSIVKGYVPDDTVLVQKRVNTFKGVG